MHNHHCHNPPGPELPSSKQTAHALVDIVLPAKELQRLVMPPFAPVKRDGNATGLLIAGALTRDARTRPCGAQAKDIIAMMSPLTSAVPSIGEDPEAPS